MSISINDVSSAMFSSIEGYVGSVVDSMEFSLGRSLTAEEQNKVYEIVDNTIFKGTQALETKG